MNPDIKKRWLEALRGGEYAQARSTLRGEDSFCCLGVLNDLSGLGTWSDHIYEISYKKAKEVVPEVYKKWLAEADEELLYDLLCWIEDEDVLPEDHPVLLSPGLKGVEGLVRKAFDSDKVLDYLEKKRQHFPEEEFAHALVVHWAGLPCDQPPVEHAGEKKSLAELNDDGASFLELADLIEAQL